MQGAIFGMVGAAAVAMATEGRSTQSEGSVAPRREMPAEKTCDGNGGANETSSN